MTVKTVSRSAEHDDLARAQAEGFVLPTAVAFSGTREAEECFLAENSNRLELEYPLRLVSPPAWVGHFPFAFWIVENLRPSTIVELGVHTGNSYCAFLQAVRALNLETRCFGIDHWQGDAHAGYYGDEIYHELCAYHNPLYGTFSTLVRGSFDEALSKFSAGTIDILHIDGPHTYEAASKVFRNWLPKMSSRGVVLFHDTNVHEHDFSIWRVWEEVIARFPHFEFLHSHGLGVAYVGDTPVPALLRGLFGAKRASEQAKIRRYFARLGTSVRDRFALHETERMVQVQSAEIAAAKDDLDRLKTENEEYERRLVMVDHNLRRVVAEQENALEERVRLERECTRLERELDAARVIIRTVRRLQRNIIISNIRESELELRAELEAKLSKSELEAKLRAIVQSTSWRLTAPLRTVVDKVTGRTSTLGLKKQDP
jgi:Methyltransferase domain